MQEADIENPQPQTLAFKSKKNKKSRVLLVEDDMISRKVMQYMVENSGCECDTVIIGEEALQLFKEKEYDLVFMDHGLPGELDGEQTTQHIRAYEDEMLRKDKVPIIMVSAHLFYQDHPQMYEAGCTHIINKPLRPDQLREIFEYYGLSVK
jgi:CheY-like chemotaxis protein